MNKVLVKSVFTVGLLAMLMAVPVYGASVNKSIRVPAGGESDGESSVNGSITVGDGAVVTGGLHTVNGSIKVGANAKIESAETVNGSVTIADGVVGTSFQTVNGSIRIGADVNATGDLETVNGRISAQNGSTITGNAENVNGSIGLDGSEIGGDVSTVTGDVALSDGATIKGDLIIRKPSMWSFGNKKKRDPEIVIGPGSTVAGVIRIEHEVKLYISETANVGGVEGVMSMDDAVRFSGDKP